MARKKNPVRKPGSPATTFFSRRERLIARTLERWLDGLPYEFPNISIDNVIASRFNLENGMTGLKLYVPSNKKLKDNTLTGMVAWSYVDSEDGYAGKPFIQYAYQFDLGEHGWGRVEGVGSTDGSRGGMTTALRNKLYSPINVLDDNYFGMDMSDQWELAMAWASDPNNPQNQPQEEVEYEVDWEQSMADFTERQDNYWRNMGIGIPKKKNPVASSIGSIALAGLAGYLIGKK